MESLPNELMHNICSHLNVPTLKALRSTCKQTADSPIPWLFNVVYLGLYRYSFENLEAISRHPIMKHSVSELILCPGSLVGEPPVYNRKMATVASRFVDEFRHVNAVPSRRFLHRVLPFIKSGDYKWTQPRRRNHRVRYYMSLEAQWSFDKEMPRFLLALSNLTQLKHVRLWEFDHIDGPNRLIRPSPVDKNVFEKTFLYPLSVRRLAQSWLSKDINPDWAEHEHEKQELNRKLLFHTLESLARAKTPLQSLSISISTKAFTYLQEETLQSGDLHAGFSTTIWGIQVTGRVSEKLQILQLRLDGLTAPEKWMSADANQRKVWTALKSTLRKASSLEHLELIGNYGSGDIHLLDDVKWGKLRQLIIRTALGNTDDFVHVITQHASTLDRVLIRNCYLTPYDTSHSRNWFDFFRRVPELSLPCKVEVEHKELGMGFKFDGSEGRGHLMSGSECMSYPSDYAESRLDRRERLRSQETRPNSLPALPGQWLIQLGHLVPRQGRWTNESNA